MQNQGRHFVKQWPQGVVDNSDGDSEIFDMFNTPLPRKPVKEEVKITYPWAFDQEETLRTENSLKQAEKVTGKKLTLAGVKNGGMDMIFEYDNQHGRFEQNTPHGNTWWKAPVRQYKA
jgi:hypothetical protein